MKTIRERFPQMSAVAPVLADLPADLQSPAILMQLVSVAAAGPQLAAQNGGPKEMDMVAELLAREMIGARTATDERAIDLLLLAVSSFPLEWWCGRHDVDRAWLWAVVPMAESFPSAVSGSGAAVPIDVVRPANAAGVAPAMGVDLLIRWAGAVCYLAWAHGYLTTEATIVAEVVDAGLHDALSGRPSVQRVLDISHIAVWQERVQARDPTRLMVRLGELFEDETQRTGTRVAAGRSLATAVGELSGVSRQQRARDVLGRVQDLHPTDRLHLLTTSLAGSADGLLERFDEVEAAVTAHVDWIRATATDPLQVLLARGREWGLLIGPVADLVLAGEVEHALTLIGRWFGVPSGDERRDDVLVALRQTSAVIWAWSGTVEIASSDTTTMLETFNEVLDTSLVDPADPTAPVRLLQRDGVPDLSAGERLFEVLQRGLRPDVARQVSSARIKPPSAVLNLCFERAPLTWMLAADGGPSLPVVTSMEKPLPDRTLRYAELWVGDMLGAQEEAEAVAEILEDSGCSVALVDPRVGGVAAFVKSYQRDEVDLLWVSGHASFGHAWSEETHLLLATDEVLYLRDLVSLPRPNIDRRLLVLNSCESGVAAGLGGPSAVGIGALLAGRGQAVVSHLWPTGYREAARFGALLALGLAEHEGFTRAFELALRPLSAGPSAVAERLATHPAGARLATRWDPSESPDMMTVASPCMLE